MGGLSKKAYQLEDLRNRYELPALVLDGGNLLFKHERIAPALLQQMTISAEGIVDAYGLMHYDAVGVGRYDLAAGVAFLQAQASRSGFAWLSANLVRKSDGRPVFSPTLVRKLESLTVGVIGLTDHNAETTVRDEEDVEILPWEEVLPSYIAGLSARCDMLILLSDYPADQNEKIAGAFPDIHLIIQASPGSGNSNPKQVNNTLIVRTGKEGKYLGWMLIDWQNSGSWGRKGSVKELTFKKQELDGINGRISRIERRLKKEDLTGDSSYRNLIRQRERLSSTIDFLENELKAIRTTGGTPSTYENNFIPLEADLPDQPDVEKIVNRIKEEVNLAGRASVAETPEAARRPELNIVETPYTGWRTCAGCHKPQTEFWEKTDHASAYQTLVEAEQQYNLDCLSCHVTAEYENTKISGNVADLLTLPPELRLVGCEICHGPGRSHAATRDPELIARKPATAVCLRCHTPERDEEFNYENDLIRIACPASGTP